MEELKLFEVKMASYYLEMTHIKLICAKTIEEARQIFEAWKYYERKRNDIGFILLDIKVLRRSKRNENYYNHYLDEDYYKKELELLERFNNEYEQSKENVQEEM